MSIRRVPVRPIEPFPGATLKKTNVLLWGLQILIAALFLFAGGMKLAHPAEMSRQAGFSAAFLVFIGVVEVLGGLGLVLPGATRIQPWLTPVASAGLTIVMIGATIISLDKGPAANAVMPLVVGAITASIAYVRWRVLPLGASSTSPGSADNVSNSRLAR